MKRLLCKGDWDVEITIDVKQAAKNIDTVILLSGDDDFNNIVLMEFQGTSD